MTTTTQNQIVRIVSEASLPDNSGDALVTAFVPLFEAADAMATEAAAISVTDESQVGAMQAARDLRLRIKDVRVKAEHARKKFKEESLRTGKAIDGIGNIIKAMTEPVEERLLACEKFAERAEAARAEVKRGERAAALASLGADPAAFNLLEMTDAAFAKVKADTTALRDARIEVERKTEEDRIAKAKADAEERERIKAENEQLRKNAIEREAIAKAERARQDAALRAEREAREKVEAEARAKQEQERKAAAEAERIKAAEAAAPDREKLSALARVLFSVEMPECQTDAAKEIAAWARTGLSKLATMIQGKADAL